MVIKKRCTVTNFLCPIFFMLTGFENLLAKKPLSVYDQSNAPVFSSQKIGLVNIPLSRTKKTSDSCEKTLSLKGTFVPAKSDDAQKNTIIFLHGTPGNSQNYLKTKPFAFYRKFGHTLFYDRAESGKSVNTQHVQKLGYIDSHVADLDDVVRMMQKKTGNQKIILVAHSMGTVIAAHYAARHPTNIDALILESSVPIDKQDAEQWRLWYNKAMDGMPQTKYDQNLIDQVELDYRKKLEDDPKYFKNIYSKIQARTMIFHGKNDFLPPHIAQSIARVIPGSELRILGNTGHCIHLEKPKIYRKLFNDFMQKTN